jgi:hypothetical protein
VVRKQRSRPDVRNAFTPSHLRGSQKELQLFAVFPDSWNEKKYGPAPLLGYVYETNEYWARYAAFDGGIVRYSPISFGPKVVKTNGPILAPVIIKRKPNVPHNKTRHSQ